MSGKQSDRSAMPVRTRLRIAAILVLTASCAALLPPAAAAHAETPQHGDGRLAAQATTQTQYVYRMYNMRTGEHFYTCSKGERDGLYDAGWTYEGIGWVAPVASGTPVFRLYNPNAGDHHYTTSAAERDALERAGWSYEGIGWYSDDGMAQAIYRQYNPNTVIGTHNYTPSRDENDWLASIGWVAEGTGWYSCGPAPEGATDNDTISPGTKVNPYVEYALQQRRERVYYDENLLSEAEIEKAEAQVRAIADAILRDGSLDSQLKRVRAAAMAIAERCSQIEYDYTYDYNTHFWSPYGVLVAGKFTCAGSTKTLGRVLDYLGIPWAHQNENKSMHQWCRLTMDGKPGMADAAVLPNGIAFYDEDNPLKEDYDSIR